jgi:hypothetical protein
MLRPLPPLTPLSPSSGLLVVNIDCGACRHTCCARGTARERKRCAPLSCSCFLAWMQPYVTCGRRERAGDGEVGKADRARGASCLLQGRDKARLAALGPLLLQLSAPMLPKTCPPPMSSSTRDLLPRSSHSPRSTRHCLCLASQTNPRRHGLAAWPRPPSSPQRHAPSSEGHVKARVLAALRLQLQRGADGHRRPPAPFLPTCCPVSPGRRPSIPQPRASRVLPLASCMS